MMEIGQEFRRDKGKDMQEELLIATLQKVFLPFSSIFFSFRCCRNASRETTRQRTDGRLLLNSDKSP